MANINKREVRGCIENVESMRNYIIDVMRAQPALRQFLEPLIRLDLNPLHQRLDYIESVAD